MRLMFCFTFHHYSENYHELLLVFCFNNGGFSISHIVRHVSKATKLKCQNLTFSGTSSSFLLINSSQFSTFSAFGPSGFSTTLQKQSDKKLRSRLEIKRVMFRNLNTNWGLNVCTSYDCLIQNPFQNIASFRHLFVWTRIFNRTNPFVCLGYFMTICLF